MIFKKSLKFGKLYAVTAGTYSGQFLFFVEQKNNQYGFLTIPEMKNLWVPREKFDFAIVNKIIEFVEKSPVDVKKVAKAKFSENEKTV
jgi:hypothetical protein